MILYNEDFQSFLQFIKKKLINEFKKNYIYLKKNNLTKLII